MTSGSATRKPVLLLLAASFVVLFQELTLIRWIPGEVRAIAYFPNVVLISAFLGLGLGCLRVAQRPLLWLWPVSLVILTGTAGALSRVAFTQESATEHLWLLYNDLPADAPVVRSIRFPILLFFALTALSFVPLGQFVAARLSELKDAGAPLRGYAADLLGSLLGVLVFAGFSFSPAFPIHWFTFMLVIGLVLFGRRRWELVLYIACGALILTVVGRSERADAYSPYYAITVRHDGPMITILTNGSVHQQAEPLQYADAKRVPGLDATRDGYHLPYKLIGRPVHRALILGAGTGNDVAVALDEGVEQIDAVEIDPVILRTGAELHPDHPYASAKVHTYDMDARAFLNHSSEKYDLIVFGTLDSMTRLSALSSVRLDNFVYTTECMEAVKRHLTPDGGVALYFMVSQSFISEHIAGMLVQVFGDLPTIKSPSAGLFNRIFLSGPGFRALSSEPQLAKDSASEIGQFFNAPSDDWPYLYLEHRGVDSFYLSLIAMLLATCGVAVFLTSGELRASLRAGSFDAPMFLFGLAFLLVETKLVTEMNLIWGATWLTSAVVFGAILVMILSGTILTSFRRMPWAVAATGLLVSLFATYVVPVEPVAGSSLIMRALFSLAFAGLPVFFASICFASLFADRVRPELAFGWNMIGAVAGGLLEFSSMQFGIKSATLLAILAYLLAFLLAKRGSLLLPAPPATTSVGDLG